MNTAYYVLGSPDDDERYPLYGQSIWRAQFGLAEWSEFVDFEGVTCRVNPSHQRAGKRTMDLTVILPSLRVCDFVWTWYGECLVTDRVLHLFQNAGFTGFEPRRVNVEKVKGLRKGATSSIPGLWELHVVGKGGDTDPRSGIRVLETCDACSLVRYSSFQNGLIVDENNWDGSDFFTVNGYPGFILVTERVKEMIINEKLVNCTLTPSQDLKWKSGTTPEAVFADRNALDALLYDLPHSISVLQVLEPEELDKRIDRAQTTTGTRIQKDGSNLIWIPASNPPTDEESLAWAWVLRPDLAAVASARTRSDLHWAMLKLGRYYEPL